jgi:HAD superfamily hydrolase (TIGR01509 family)
MKACIFDLDGVLLDSMDVWERIDINFLAKRGLEAPPDFFDAVNPLSFPEAAAYTIRRFGLRDSVDELLAEWNSMAVYAYGHTVPLKPHAREYLEALRERGVKRGIATSLPAALYEPALRNHAIAALFDAVCSTHEVNCGKTEPDVFLLAAQRLHTAPEDCAVFEDVPQAIQSAKRAGMIVYGVYDESSKEHWPLIRRVADGVIRDFKDAPLPK